MIQSLLSIYELLYHALVVDYHKRFLQAEYLLLTRTSSVLEASSSSDELDVVSFGYTLSHMVFIAYDVSDKHHTQK